MKLNLKSCLFPILLAAMGYLTSCDDIIEPSLSKKTVQPEAPTDGYQSISYTVNFWWDAVDHALSYHLQVVTPNFNAPGSLVLDTVVTKTTFSSSLVPGNYQWRVLAQNGSSQTPFTTARSFTVAASSIKQQSVQLSLPANNFITNQAKVAFQWGSLFGATKYQFELDTNNFADENNIVSNQTIPGQQLSITLPKDQSYQWRVKAENDTAQAQWSPIYSMVYDHTPPAQVTLVSPANGATVALPVPLKWNAVTGAQKYKLYVYQSDGTTIYNQTFPLTLTATSYSFNLGVSGDKIFWTVTAVDSVGNESQPGALSNFVLP